jgi:hypothetical protein
MALSEQEKAALGQECSNGSDSPQPEPPKFADLASRDLETLLGCINQAEAVGAMTQMVAAVHRLYVYTLMDSKARPLDRAKAMDGLAKLQGLFVDVVRDERETSNRDKPMAVLLAEFQNRVGISGLVLEEFSRQSGNGVKPAALLTVSNPALDALPMPPQQDGEQPPP